MNDLQLAISMPGMWEWLAIGIVALIVFGPKRLPELGQGVGKMLREFRKATDGITDELNNQGPAKTVAIEPPSAQPMSQAPAQQAAQPAAQEEKPAG